MPKQRCSTKESVLSAAKEILLSGDVDDFTIRAVARRSGVSIGTVYNCFASKDILAASIMLGDWVETLAEIRQDCRNSKSVVEAMTTMHGRIMHFSEKYRSVWSHYRTEGNFAEEYGKRHRQLTEQLAECLEIPIGAFWQQSPQHVATFIAENLLLCTGDSCITLDVLVDIVDRLQK